MIKIQEHVEVTGLGIEIDANLKKRIKEISKKSGVTMRKIVEAGLTEYIREYDIENGVLPGEEL